MKKRTVLIYPYWNVNTVLFACFSVVTRVLIYPYWNVNHTLALPPSRARAF